MDDSETDEQQEDIPMSPDAFRFAITDVKMTEAIRKAARLVMVDGLDRTEACSRTGVSYDALNKAIIRINDNLEHLLESEQLVYERRIMEPEMDKGMARHESLVVEARMSKTGRRKRE